MKKFFVCGALLFMACITFVSCMGDDSMASATSTYVSRCDSLKFTDENDTVFYDLVVESFDSLGVTGYKSRFTKSAEIDYSSTMMAIAICDSLARDSYKAALEKHTMSDIKENIYANHRDSLAALGYASASELPLDRFTAYYSMFSTYTYNYPMAKFEKTY